MRHFGVNVRTLADNRYVIPNDGYVAPRSTLLVEPDASSATYALAMAAVTGGDVTVRGVGSSSLQGDASFCHALERMGCEVHQTATSTRVTRSGSNPLRGVDIDMMTMTDAFMTLVAVAAVAEGVTRITGIANQRVKECDRIAAMVRELAKCGVKAWELEDGT